MSDSREREIVLFYCGFVLLLTGTLTALKLLGAASVSWALVTAPVWLSLMAFVGVCVVVIFAIVALDE